MEVKKIQLIWLGILSWCSILSAQQRSLTIEDMATWQQIEYRHITANGKWVAYEVDAELGDPSVHFYQTETGKTYSFPESSKPRVSVQEEWAVFTKKAPEEVVKSLKRAGKKDKDLPLDTLCILQLGENTVTKYPGLQNYILPDSLPDYLIYSTSSPYTPKDSTDKDPRKARDKDNGYDVVVLNLRSLKADTISLAKEWMVSPQGHRILAQTTAADTTDKDKWLTYDVASGERHVIYSGKGEVQQKSWSHDGQKLALIVDRDTTKNYIRTPELHIGDYQTVLSDLSMVPVTWMDSTWVINVKVEPNFSPDDRFLFFKYGPHPLYRDSTMLDEEVVDVEIWTTWDEYVYPMQNKNADELKKGGKLAWLEVESKSLRGYDGALYSDYSYPNEEGQTKLLVTDNTGYAKYITWKGHDYKRVDWVDLETGGVHFVGDSIHGNPQFSPDQQWIYWWSFPDTAWIGFHTPTQKKFTWTDNEEVPFYRETHDYPALPWSYGIMGFSEDESKVYIYDRYDIWEIPTQKSDNAQRVTTGRNEMVRYRYIDLDDDERFIPVDEPLLVHVFSEKNKGSQYGHLHLSRRQLVHEALEPLAYSTRVEKGKNSSKILFTKENYSTFPDLLLAEDMSFEKINRITELNPRQEDIAWGSIELFEWKMNGEMRQGMVVKPSDFDPNKKYPLIVNFYEKSSDRLHRHRRPYLHRSTINYPFYASKGYVIFNPDVNYQVGDPGLSATETVLAGVEALTALGWIDEDRMALQGHSWGGYQIAHILTQTDIFACAESGAPVVNMTSAYGGIRWGSGMSRMFQYEKTQSRLGATLWEDRETYLRNSPLFNMDKVTTPVLILHNDEDGAVPWYQGIEYYMALRRLDKPAWLLNYRGEPHWPLKFQNRKDFQTRMSQFFDHFLMDAPQPVWMKQGVPAHERGLNDGLD